MRSTARRGNSHEYPQMRATWSHVRPGENSVHDASRAWEPQAHLTRRSRGGGTEAMELAPGAGPSPVSWSPQLTSTVRRGPRCVSGDSVAPERVLLKRRGAVYGGRPTRPGKNP